jgi:hypothetical protein
VLAVAGDVVVASDGYYMMSGVDHRTAKELWTLPDPKADWIGQPDRWCDPDAARH